MTVSIYQNPFVFEKRGQAFSSYIGLCIKHFNDKKDELGLTTRHHINPKFLTNNVYDDSPWNLVHLLHEVHIEAHTYLKEAMPDNPKARTALTRLISGGCQRLRKKKYFEDENNRLKSSEAMKKKWEDPDYVAKQQSWDRSEAQIKSWEDPDRKLKAKQTQNKRWEDPNERLKTSESMSRYLADPANRLKRSEAAKKVKKIKCEYCGREISPQNFKRHVDKCKLNPNRIA
jgi:hypothetical protein